MEDHAAAARVVFEFTPEIPLWAQLTHLAGEDMISQFAAGLPGLRTAAGKQYVDAGAPDFDGEILGFYEDYLALQDGRCGIDASRFALAEPAIPGLFALLRALGGRATPPLAVKGQITGPFTLGTGLRDHRDRAIFYDPQLRDALVKLIAGRARWQVQRLAESGVPVILFVDEPVMAGFGSSEYISVQREDILSSLREVIAAVHDQNGLAGVHVCANTDWALILESGADIVSFDAFAYFERFILYRDAIARFVQAGGILAWGIVPTLSPEDLRRASADTLTARLRAQLGQVSALGIPLQRLLAQSLVTPACGMGTLSPELARRALKLTRAVSDRIRTEDWKDS
jgi:methionine synthase II (cobalamin-independent)